MQSFWRYVIFFFGSMVPGFQLPAQQVQVPDAVPNDAEGQHADAETTNDNVEPQNDQQDDAGTAHQDALVDSIPAASSESLRESNVQNGPSDSIRMNEMDQSPFPVAASSSTESEALRQRIIHPNNQTHSIDDE